MMPFALVRKPMLTLAAAGAIGGPYWAANTDSGKSAMQTARGWLESAPSNGAPLLASGGGMHAHHETEKLYQNHYDPGRPGERDTAFQRIAGGPFSDFRDVIRFDIGPRWVAEHFSRVTTVLSDPRLEGLRVPVVTGTDPTDVAGSLTYYFDHHHRVQRIILQGFTGDPSRMVGLMQQFYNMAAEPTLDADVMVTRWNGKITSVLKTSRAPVMYADADHARYTVFLELNQPGLAYGLSDSASQIVTTDEYSGRL